jgi:ABC-2 type transport system permease protein
MFSFKSQGSNSESKDFLETGKGAKIRLLELIKRNLKENYRDPLSVGFLLGFPLVFMLLMGLAFGEETIPTFTIGIIDQDRTQVSQTFTDEALAEASTLEVSSYNDPDEARDDLKLGDLNAYLIIPEGFGEQVSQSWRGKDVNIILDITYDESDLMVADQVVSIIDSIARSFAGIEIPLTLNQQPIHVEREITYIDFIAPGIIIFGLLILIPTSARMMLHDKEKGFLSRLLTTPARPLDFILGYSLSLAFIAIAQIIIFLVISHLMGMDIVGNPALAFLTFLLTGLCCIGIGMIVASLTKSESQGEPLCWIIAMPLAMVSGCWFSIEFMPQWLRGVANAFPFAHAIEASRGVLTRGSGLEAISTDLLYLVVWTMAVFIVGVMLFRKRSMVG